MSALAQRETGSPHSNDRPPRDGLVRLWATGSEPGAPRGITLRDVDASGTSSPTLVGHFAVFNRWTEIDSFFEGTFMERIAPGAFKKTFKEQASSIRVLFQHGRDTQLGMKPLGSISELREDNEGAYYEVPLFRGIPDIIMDGLRENQYGASFKFRVMKEDIVSEPKPSEENPRGLDERTIREAQVFEFGPVTFPAYPEATAGLRSLTDDYILDGMAHADPELVRMAANGVDLAGLIARRMGVPPTTFNFNTAGRSGGEVAAATSGNEAGMTVRESDPTCPTTMPHGVLDANGTLVACHSTVEQARAHAGQVGAVTRTSTTDGEEGEQETGTADEAGTGTQDEDRDGATGAADDGQTERTSDKETAEPGASSTPLIGPAGHRESWRL